MTFLIGDKRESSDYEKQKENSKAQYGITKWQNRDLV